MRSQARLIDDLLDISRILSGKLTLDMQQADAAEVVQRAVEVVRSATAERHITIDVSGDVAERLAMRTDPVRLEQMVWNLINNAVQATANGGRVEVNLQANGSTLCVKVRDWGKGIEPCDLPHIFEPFRQGPRSDTSHRGLGLGLATRAASSISSVETCRCTAKALDMAPRSPYGCPWRKGRLTSGPWWVRALEKMNNGAWLA